MKISNDHKDRIINGWKIFLVARAVLDEQNKSDRRSSSSGQTSLPSRSFRYLQEQYNNDNNPTTTITTTTTTVEETDSSRDHNGLRRSSDAHTPSRSFKYLQEQYATSEQSPTNRSHSVNNRDDLMEIYNKRKINQKLFSC